MAQDDNIFDPSKVIAALRAKGIPDSEIAKLYGPLKPEPKVNLTPQKKKQEKTKAKTKAPPKPKRKNWTTTETERLKKLYGTNAYSLRELAKEFDVTIDAITSKIKRLKDSGWDGLSPETPQEKIKTKRFERLREATKKTAKKTVHHTKRAARFLNEEFGSDVANHLEKNFGVLGRGVARATKLGHHHIDENILKAKLSGGGNGASIEAITKSNEIVVGSLSKLNKSISKGTSSLGKTISKSTSKVMDRVSNVERTTKKIGFENTVQQKGKIASTFGAGGTSFGKLAMMGGVALASGIALNSLIGDGSDYTGSDETSDTNTDASKKPDANPFTPKKENNGSEELRIKANEIEFNAKDVTFEYDNLKFNERGGSGGSFGSSGGSAEKADSQGVFPSSKNDDGSVKTDLGGFNPSAPASIGDRFGSPQDTSLPPDMSPLSPDKVKESIAGQTGMQKQNIPDWLGGATYKGPTAQKAGQFRNQYSLSDADLNPRVLATIAGEAYTNNQRSVDAVINNMLNRVGTKGYGPSKNLLDVATAPGQYVGNRQPTKKEAEFIEQRIKAIASGSVDDITGGSNEYRAEYYRGPWFQKHMGSPVIGGNRFGVNPDIKPGPYAPYSQIGQPKIVPASPLTQQNPIPGLTPEQLQNPIDSGKRLNLLQGEEDSQQMIPKHKKKWHQDNPTKHNDLISDTDGDHSKTVLETQGPNHFEEAGFPDGSNGIGA